MSWSAGSSVNSLKSIEINSFWRSGPRKIGTFNFSESACDTSAMLAFSAFSERFRTGRVLIVQTKLGLAAGFLSAGCCAQAFETDESSKNANAASLSWLWLSRSLTSIPHTSIRAKLPREKRSVNLCFKNAAKWAREIMDEGETTGQRTRVDVGVSRTKHVDQVTCARRDAGAHAEVVFEDLARSCGHMRRSVEKMFNDPCGKRFESFVGGTALLYFGWQLCL